MITDTIDIAGIHGGSVNLTSGEIDDLASRFKGPLLRPGDNGWDDAVLIWNAMAAKVPNLVLQPTSAQDIATAVGFARDHHILISIKGGGHNIAGTSIAEHGLTLDMSRMRSVDVNSSAQLAHVGPGCLLQDVDRATQQHGLATVLGFVSETGVAGLTLGGGFGYLTRRFGWAADNLEEVEIVTADGEICTANRNVNSDLFWALRGGGGNFGVVSRFTFRLHEVGPTITGGLIAWGADRADEVLATYREITESAPRELTTAIEMLTAPPAPFIPEKWHGKLLVGILVCHVGVNAEADLAPLRALGEPVFDLISEKPYVAQQSMTDDMVPKGLHQYWKTEYLADLSTEYLETFRESAVKATSPLSYSVIFHVGGALNELRDDDGAVGNRGARFISGFSGVWLPDEEHPEEHVAWVRESWERIRPFSTGGNYVNFQMAEDDSGRTADAYGNNYERLQRIKAKYDPHNLFRVNRNIPPAV